MRTTIEIFEGIPDYRKGNAIRHRLADILMIGLLTIICIWRRIRGDDHIWPVLRQFLELPYGIPSEDTFERVFARLNSNMLASQFLEWIDEFKGKVSVSIDGKTIRGSKSKEKKPSTLLRRSRVNCSGCPDHYVSVKYSRTKPAREPRGFNVLLYKNPARTTAATIQGYSHCRVYPNWVRF